MAVQNVAQLAGGPLCTSCDTEGVSVLFRPPIPLSLSLRKRLAPSFALEKFTGQKLTNGLCNVALFEGCSIYKANDARRPGDKHTNTSNTGVTKNGRFPYDEQKLASAESVLLILHKTSFDCRKFSLYAKRKINFNWQ